MSFVYNFWTKLAQVFWRLLDDSQSYAYISAASLVECACGITRHRGRTLEAQTYRQRYLVSNKKQGLHGSQLLGSGQVSFQMEAGCGKPISFTYVKALLSTYDLKVGLEEHSLLKIRIAQSWPRNAEGNASVTNVACYSVDLCLSIRKQIPERWENL
jgi:hypothetical protein